MILGQSKISYIGNKYYKSQNEKKWINCSYIKNKFCYLKDNVMKIDKIQQS